MNVSICVEDIMTPRRLLQHAATDAAASAIAKAGNFDAVPITGHDGRVREFWSRQLERRISIRSRNLVPHDCPILDLLPVVAVHTVQFVHYRLEIVGIVDASDLNKPLARLAYLQHMLELERAILDAVRFRRVSDAEPAVAIGGHAKKAQTRQRTAARGDLLLPLLDYVEFPVLLEASRHLGITKLTTEEVHALNDVRKRGPRRRRRDRAQGRLPTHHRCLGPCRPLAQTGDPICASACKMTDAKEASACFET